jgi:uncharacterized protein
MPKLREQATISSPYLATHVDNPVEWYSWGPDALEAAVADDKPLFISIGYAACHWCHVMAHESFENAEIARLLNEHFIAIKVDREERPDLDQLYMTATQAFSGHGGWPMSVFATPDGRPFFAGTYFPPHDRGGQPGFDRVLVSLAEAWRDQRAVVEEQATSLSAAVEKEATFFDALDVAHDAATISFDEVLSSLIDALAERFDASDGGFGGAPKFPRPSYVEACLVDAVRSGSQRSLAMATTTLDAMAAGGIYDHLAGGFARYSVDAKWLVPHFEKMLSDQALLVPAYLHAFQLTGNDAYAQVVTETIKWVLADLALEGGGLASSIDADADGREGSHAVFSPAQLAAILDGHDDALSPEEACAFYNVTQAGTFEEGTSILARNLGATLLRSPREERTRQLLVEARSARVQPLVDDKVLLEWNAMMASAILEAAVVLGRPDWTRSAASLVEFLDEEFDDGAGRLARSARNGSTYHLAGLSDYAWLIIAMTRLFEATGDGTWLERATLRAQQMRTLFGDPTNAGFFTTGSDSDALLVRTKDLFDGALPSATATTTTALVRLGHLTEHVAYLDDAGKLIRQARTVLGQHPIAVPDLVMALGWMDCGIELVAPGAAPGAPDLLWDRYLPFALRCAGTDERCALLSERAVDLVYVCRNGVCDLPTSDLGQVVEQAESAVRT